MWRPTASFIDGLLAVVAWLCRMGWRYRSGLAPVWGGLLVLVAGVALREYAPGWGWVPLTVALVVAPALFFIGDRLSPQIQRGLTLLVPDWVDDGRKGVLDRDTERGYLAVLLLVAGGWLFWLAGHDVTRTTLYVLAGTVGVVGVPWWWHRGFRRRKRPNRWASRWRHVEASIKEFGGSKVVRVSGDRKVTELRVRLRSGLTIRHVSGTGWQVASALSPRLRAGAVTLAPGPGARDVVVRVVPRNPWHGALLHPLPELGSWSVAEHPRRLVGRYEDDTEDLMKLGQHILVCGQTGSGKSIWLESFLSWLLTARDSAVVAADLASGATFGIWEDVFAAPLATSARDAADLLGRVFALIEFREGFLSRRKKQGDLSDVLPPSPEMPWLWVIIDEFPDLIKAAKQSTPPLDVITVLERMANKGRKVGVWLVLGAQNPTANDVGSTELRGALTGVVGLGLSERQSQTLWGTKRQEGWDSRSLTVGTYLLEDRDASHQMPRIAKGLYVPPQDRLRLIREVSSSPARLDADSQMFLDGTQPAASLGDTSRRGPITVVSPGPAPNSDLDELVLSALPVDGGTGATPVAAQLSVSRDRVEKSFRRLAEQGKAERRGRGQWVRVAETAGDSA